MRSITTALERIALCKRMRRSLVRFSEPASYVRSLSWVDFIINTFGFSFRYTQDQADFAQTDFRRVKEYGGLCFPLVNFRPRKNTDMKSYAVSRAMLFAAVCVRNGPKRP